jgi:Flp pilus assembly protein TadG
MLLKRGAPEAGSSLVEFALLMPLLVLLLLGLVEFGYLLGEYNEVRHGAHEAARLAAVDDDALLTNSCNSIELTNGTVSFDFTDSASGDVGEQASVTVSADIDSLSGFGAIEALLPAALTTTADFKLERPSSNWAGSDQDGSC